MFSVTLTVPEAVAVHAALPLSVAVTIYEYDPAAEALTVAPFVVFMPSDHEYAYEGVVLFVLDADAVISTLPPVQNDLSVISARDTCAGFTVTDAGTVDSQVRIDGVCLYMVILAYPSPS